ncbi:hypothetical protein HanRHA438_Chr06g0273701 [Helianthus annuus]|uniref:Uncharacterized protein n=1 Tax=Helianthus annuus TaxID=4232 RepID=A0A9K3NKD3_HELAN|nr:hypothetical protein HanXRQr2_Chr06g0264401 [Helianthus annuus]KAJ0560919.1 hypothetical protein HanHA300_Chr06g0216891 [Helianthus annuus]KAJ0567407.1 hypothetical protein HanIR_Chr06g0284451 [Helianthus annuus]KAJ0573960.1 hypothetical protein HanHA89_Chr06g0232711 [Helianthus annuus]KAJ0738293.1 hypothetical protein HanLR1_Chr06g0216621 [Helianthus annuus]
MVSQGFRSAITYRASPPTTFSGGNRPQGSGVLQGFTLLRCCVDFFNLKISCKPRQI